MTPASLTPLLFSVTEGFILLPFIILQIFGWTFFLFNDVKVFQYLVPNMDENTEFLFSGFSPTAVPRASEMNVHHLLFWGRTSLRPGRVAWSQFPSGQRKGQAVWSACLCHLDDTEWPPPGGLRWSWDIQSAEISDVHFDGSMQIRSVSIVAWDSIGITR